VLSLLRVLKGDVSELVRPWQERRTVGKPAAEQPEADVTTWRTLSADLDRVASSIVRLHEFVDARLRAMMCPGCDRDLTPAQVAAGDTTCGRPRCASGSRLHANMHARNPGSLS
jgi:hypothetical protein